MKTEDFDYELPKELIAQTPLTKRDESRLLVLERKTGNITHDIFHNIVDYLNNGDVLVLNNSKVIPARLFGIKEKTNAVIEMLLLREIKDHIWETLVKPARRIKLGTIINFNDKLKAKCIKILEEGRMEFELFYDGILYEILNALGEMPLPPYITVKLNEKNRYQTIYAKHEGSAAAPTAGLHFTNELLTKIKKKGIQIVYITLHIGLGTFKPVKTEKIEDHIMHSEYYEMDKKTANILNKAKNNQQRIIAVGTTTTRTLETIIDKYNQFVECNGWTNIFIYSGYQFKAIDALITNFHLPKSTLLMLVSAFASKELIMKAYNEAIKNKYRFFSFGDSMFIK
jgi:S-adenosylmethionine:tRNA ribosyltransferase-isomerase